MIDRPWEPETAVDTALARRLVEARFPELAPAQVELLGDGWDNTAHLVNRAVVFRFPRRQVAAPLIATEIALLPWLAPQLPLPVPVPSFVGEPAGDFPWTFAGYPALDGRDVPLAALTREKRSSAAAPLARFLAALHAIPAGEARRRGAPGDTIARLDFAVRNARTRERLARLAEGGALADVAPLVALIDAAPDAYHARSDTIVHGDLHAGQLLVGPGGEPAAVIDWGDLHVGDPAIDLGIAPGFLPPEAHAAFRDAYGPIAPEAWTAAVLRALWVSVVLLAYAIDRENEPLEREARTALSFLAEGGVR